MVAHTSHREYLLDFGKKEQKEAWYCKIMPNGRIPALVDHWNNDKIVWESNAMLKYIATRYDTEGKFLVTDPDQQTDMDTCKLYLCFTRPFTSTWWMFLILYMKGLFFQSSHQGPYFGQLQWFSYYHDEFVPSAIIR
jgi:glutathione S-transferase